MAENTKTNGSAEEISQKYLPKDNKIEVSCIWRMSKERIDSIRYKLMIRSFLKLDIMGEIAATCE